MSCALTRRSYAIPSGTATNAVSRFGDRCLSCWPSMSDNRRPPVHDDEDEDERLFQQFQQAGCRPSPEKQKRQRERFVKVPLWWMEQAMRASKTPAGYLCVW